MKRIFFAAMTAFTIVVVSCNNESETGTNEADSINLPDNTGVDNSTNSEINNSVPDSIRIKDSLRRDSMNRPR